VKLSCGQRSFAYGEAGKLNFTWTKIPYFTASKTSNFTFAQAKTSRNEPENKTVVFSAGIYLSQNT